MSVLPYPPLVEDAKFVVLSDWDGTITDKDSNDYMTDNLGMVLEGSITYRDSFASMLDSVHEPFEKCKEYLRDNIGLDPGFQKFYDWCKTNGIPVIIVSSGMAPTIRAVLSKVLPADADTIPVIANDVRFDDPSDPNSPWHIVYRHPESGFGHDKSKAILPYRDVKSKPTLFFCGDGVSDLSAAKHADVLFAKVMANGDSDLLEYCKRENIPNVPFKDFNLVLEKVKEVVEGKSVADVLKGAGN
ncbi:Pdp3-interacting factor 1 [Saitozyma sp. JCM 24511]|nr:Pdp3-interacting factor 1 [Saitozyma sp. JCM 24511]